MNNKEKKNKIIRFCLSQINTTVGDIKGNSKKILEKIKKAEMEKTDIIIFPELSVCGYPPEDLILKKGFVDDNLKALKIIAKNTGDIIAIVGFLNRKSNQTYNSAAVLYKGKCLGVYNKINLPNYGVFDEKRYFASGEQPVILNIDGINIGISICEDLWVPSILYNLKGRIDFFVNLSSSPYHKGKWKERYKIFSKRAKEFGCEIIYVNLFGGQDELVFDGHSLVIDKKGKIIIHGSQFREDDIYYDKIVKSKNKVKLNNRIKIIKINYKLKEKSIKINTRKKFIPMTDEEEVYNALLTGTRDYIVKNGFKKAIVAVSGGIDSALVSVIAVDCLGKENVELIFMPTKFTSRESYKDAVKLSKNLGIKLKIINIQPIFEIYLKILNPFFKGFKQDITEENLQSRIRGNLVMAFSNKFKSIVLTTGNKSEMSTGYATLYGDMAGGFAVIKDIPKTLVYKLAKYRNKKAGFDLIPKNILKKEPTAELKYNQKDSDTLPPYPLLDKIIEDYIENDKTYNELKNKYPNLKKVIRMIDASEYKRRQAPPGVKITPKAFGKDRRMPIVNKYFY